jgi:hypothetical protein
MAAGLALNPWVLAWLMGVDRPRAIYLLLIGAADLAVIAAGWLLASGRLRPRRLFFIAMIALVSLLAVEGGVRLFFAARNWLTPPDRRRTATGWETAADEHIHRDLPGFGLVNYHTTTGGFRVFGDPETTRTKLLFIGDSYTQGYTVSTGETFAERIAVARPDVELFSHGCGGYGTLQEWMILDRWFDTIRPDLIVWQFCSNDLFNNDRELEAASHGNNNQMTRPYLENGEVIYAFPFQDFGPLHRLVRHSAVLRLLNLQLNSLKSPGESIEATLSPEHPWVRRSLATTEEILFRARARTGGTAVAAFSTDRNPWAPGELEAICRRVGIVWLPGVPEAIGAAEAAGQTIDGRPHDTHWNAAGHAIVAAVLARELTEAGLLPEK